jgi:hypothetical protein
VLAVTIAWDGTTTKLYLNGTLMQSTPCAKVNPAWTAGSIFDLGAYEYASYGGYSVSDDIIDEFTVVGPPIVPDTTPPTVNLTSPANGSTVSGTITLSANASDNLGLPGVQFQLDRSNLGTLVTGLGPSYSMPWDSTAVANGTHTLAAVATDSAGNTSTSSISVSVNNPIVAPVISGVAASSITTSSAVISWTTDKPSDSQVAYGLTNAYGSTSPLATALVTSHSVTLTGLASGTTYHFQVLSRGAQAALAKSADFTFMTATRLQTVLLRQADGTETNGVVNGSIIIPSTAPAGFTGTVVVHGTGSVNFAPAQSGNGVYFLNCCGNTNDAYYKFTGATIGTIFNINEGQISFYLKSRYSWAQRQASAASARYAFHVRDASNDDLFYFRTEVNSGLLQFTYAAGGGPVFYWLTQGTEDALFGSGVILKVTITWNGSLSKLYLNDQLVVSPAYTMATPNWTAASNFDLGAYEYATFGGYNVSDDIIDGFTVSH